MRRLADDPRRTDRIVAEALTCWGDGRKLLLAMPVSWKGTLQQYAGRLHRQHAGKTSVRIIEWIDLGHPVPQRMWERRLRG